MSKNQGNKSIKLDDKSKQLLEKSLNSEYKESKNNILSLYTHISNLEKKDMEKPLEVISENLKYNINTSETKESIKVLDHFIQKENSLNLNQDLKPILLKIYRKMILVKKSLRNRLISQKHLSMKLKME